MADDGCRWADPVGFGEMPAEWHRKNARRVGLLTKFLDDELDDAEAVEMVRLESEVFDELDAVHPSPFAVPSLLQADLKRIAARLESEAP